jgi:hypothetical protein
MAKDKLLRRDLLLKTGVGGFAGISGVSILGAQQEVDKDEKGKEEEVSPAEDLMREHGVLKRVLLIYREVMNRIDSKRDFPPDMVMSSAKLIRSFVEDYHEKLEEDYLFPRFERANKLVDLVNAYRRTKRSSLGARSVGGYPRHTSAALYIAI